MAAPDGGSSDRRPSNPSADCKMAEGWGNARWSLHSSRGRNAEGGPISPVLSNLYLHFTLDLWFEKKFKPQCRGEAYLVRFADDFVGCFQFQGDAQQFQRQLQERFAQFNLEMAGEKTRMLLFGRFAAATRGKHGQRPETFEFLGFKHVCGVDRSGRFALIRIPCIKSCKKFLARTREWLLEHRHWKRREQQQHLTAMLRGFYQYFALHHCDRKLHWIRYEVQRQWSWEQLGQRPWFELPFARNLHPTV